MRVFELDSLKVFDLNPVIEITDFDADADDGFIRLFIQGPPGPPGTGGGGRVTKAGVVVGADFSGSPKIAAVTFATAFTDSTYVISICGTDGRTYTYDYETKTPTGFIINSNAAAVILGEVSWVAMASGET